MTDNEKRAHDLAVSMVPVLYKIQLEDAIRNAETIDVDIYKDYIKLYNSALKAVNHDFPQDK